MNVKFSLEWFEEISMSEKEEGLKVNSGNFFRQLVPARSFGCLRPIIFGEVFLMELAMVLNIVLGALLGGGVKLKNR